MGAHEQIGDLYDSTPEMIYLCTHCRYNDCVGDSGCAARRKIIARMKGVERLEISRQESYELDGVKKRISEWAREYGIQAQTVTKRLQRGIPLREALTMQPERGQHRGKLIDIDGEVHPSYTWFKILKVSPERIKNMMRRKNISIEQAIRIVIAKKVP